MLVHVISPAKRPDLGWKLDLDDQPTHGRWVSLLNATFFSSQTEAERERERLHAQGTGSLVLAKLRTFSLTEVTP